MSSNLRKMFLVVLCIVAVLTGSLPTGFAVNATPTAESSAALVSPSNAPVSKIVTINGLLKGSQAAGSFTLVSGSNKYSLKGAIKGLGMYVEKQISVTGLLKNTDLQVLSFKLIPSPKVTPSPVPKVTPTPTPSTIPQKYDSLTGDLKIIPKDDSKDSYRYLLGTEKGVYELTGSTDGLQKVNGLKIQVFGNMIYTFAPTEYPIFKVEYYKVLSAPTSEPTPTSSIVSLEGVLQTADVAKFLLKTESGIYSLTGKTDGLEKYIGKSIRVTGTQSMLAIYPPVFIVETFELIENPSYVTLTGTLKRIASPISSSVQYPYQLVTDKVTYTLTGKLVPEIDEFVDQLVEVTGTIKSGSDKTETLEVISISLVNPPAYITVEGTLKSSDDKIGSGYLLVTDKQEYYLSGKTDGIEKYEGQTIRVTGTISPLAIYPPILVVETFAPVSSPAPIGSTHSIISDKILGFQTPDISFTNPPKGSSAISWTENSNRAFFDAKVLHDDKTTYEFVLVSAKTIDKSSIKGTFNILKNGTVVAKEVSGQVYGLDQPLGSYFKFYTDDSTWHVSAYIVQRADF